jgi:hypothetical protein
VSAGPLRPDRRRGVRLLLSLVLLVVVFGLGTALGEALHDNPRPGGTQTIVRTLRPLPIAPAAVTTVTVTSSNR